MKSVQRGVSTAQRDKALLRNITAILIAPFLTQHSTAEKDVAMFPP